MPTGSELLKARLRAALTPALLAASALTFVCGIAVPFFDVTKFWVFTDSVSVLSGLLALMRAGEWFLVGVLGLFTVGFPAVKIGALSLAWWRRERDAQSAARCLRWVAHLGKWSMLDVFVVAILVVTIKASQLAKISVDAGVYLFTASVVLTQFSAQRLERRLR